MTNKKIKNQTMASFEQLLLQQKASKDIIDTFLNKNPANYIWQIQLPLNLIIFFIYYYKIKNKLSNSTEAGFAI